MSYRMNNRVSGMAFSFKESRELCMCVLLHAFLFASSFVLIFPFKSILL